MKKYFVYELKKSLFIMCALAVIATAVYVIAVITQVNDILGYGLRRLNLGAIVAMGGVFSVLVPIWKLRYLMKKRSVDLYYSMPLSHVRILAVKLLVGLIVLFASFTVAFWIGSFTAMGALSKYEDLYKYMNCVSFVPMFFAMFVPMAVIYALTAFIFTRANRFIDGIMFVSMALMVLGVLGDCLSTFLYIKDPIYTMSYQYYFHSFNFTPFGALDIIAAYFGASVFANLSTTMDGSATIDITAIDWVGLCLIAALGIAAGIGLFFAERKAKAENCEQISGSFFGYKVMIPLYAFALALLSARLSLVLTSLVAAAAYAVSVLYKRTPRIGWIFAVIVGVAFLVGAVLGFFVSSENILKIFLKML